MLRKGMELKSSGSEGNIFWSTSKESIFGTSLILCKILGQHHRPLHIASEFIAWRFKYKADITKSSLELKLLASKSSSPLLSPPPSVSSSTPHRDSSHPPLPPIFSPASRRAPIHRSRTRNCCCIQRCTPRCPHLLPWEIKGSQNCRILLVEVLLSICPWELIFCDQRNAFDWAWYKIGIRLSNDYTL